MALLAGDSRERAEQLALLTERLTELIHQETERIEARTPPLDGAEAEEKNRLANAYRLELARIKQDRALIDTAPPELLARLRRLTDALHQALAAHEIALSAVKSLTEGLVQAMAEEIGRVRNAGAPYGAQGAIAAPAGPSPTVLDRSA